MRALGGASPAGRERGHAPNARTTLARRRRRSVEFEYRKAFPTKRVIWRVAQTRIVRIAGAAWAHLLPLI